MKLAFLAPTAHDLGGTANAVITQANALCADHDVTIVSIYRHRPDTHYDIDKRVKVQDVVDLTGRKPKVKGLSARETEALRRTAPLLIHPSEDPTIDALADAGLEHALPLLDADVVVTTTPALMAYACQLAPSRAAIVHQEHRSSSQRASSRDLLLHYARRVEAVVMLTEPMVAWMKGELGPAAPEVLAVPNAVPTGFRPRSLLTEPVIISAGRLAGEKQFPQLLAAFAQVADQLPEWRVRIFGDGPARFETRAAIRKFGLWDRVELPGSTQDMASELARASIMSLTSFSEAFPLVVQEAMAAGLPVVSYDMPSGARAQVDDGVDGLLVTNGSVAGMASALLRVAQDDELRQRLGAAALAKAATWDSATITARWVEIYERAAARRSPGPGRSTQVLRRRAEALLEAGVADSDEPEHRALPTAVAVDQAPAGREGHGVTPQQAREQTVALVAGLAREVVDGGAPWFAIPPHGDTTPVVVLPMPHRRAFLEALARADLPTWLSLHDPEHRGWPSRRGTAAEMLAPLLRGRSARLLLEPWPRLADGGSLLGRGCGVAVEFWEVDPTGDLYSPERPSYTRVLSHDTTLVDTDVLGTTLPTHPAMAEPTFTDCRFEVDVVYTWVDGNDPAWDAKRVARLGGTGDATMRSTFSSGRARYLDRGELKYSMRGLHLFAPWVRTIHLVTDGQVPAWLDPDHPRVNLVDHRDILPADALPTFNSHAIEAALHRIDGLAEQFLYFNDDMFIATPSVPEWFFTGTGANRVFLSHTVVGLAERDLRPWQLAGDNNRRLLREAFGRTLVNSLVHAPYAHRRSTLAEVAERWPDEVGATMRAPFRSATDLSMLSSFAQYYGLGTGSAVVGEIDSAFVDLTDAHVARRCRELLDRERQGFCLGDGHDFARDPASVAEIVTEFLESYFPIAAPWER